MESVGRFFLRFLCLLLAFLLGFLCCVGALVGVGFYAYNKVTFDDVNDRFTKLDTDGVIDRDQAEVLITGLTIKGMVDEVKELIDLGDSVTIDMLIDRYGVIVSDDVYAYLNADIRKIPVNKLFTEDGLNTILESVYIGSILKFDRVENESGELIWVDSEKNEVTGIEAFAADITLADIVNGNVRFDTITEELTISDVLNLESVTLPAYTMAEDESLVPVDGITEVTLWYQNDGSLTADVIGSVASSSIASVGSSFNTVAISDVIGYVSVPYVDDNGEEKVKLYSKTVVEAEDKSKYVLLTEEKNGLTTEFGSLVVGELSDGGIGDVVNSVELIDVLGYENRDGVWYDKNGDEAESYMVALLYTPDGTPTTINNISDSIGGIQVGKFSGYTFDEEKNAWVDKNGAEAEGIIAAIADMTVDQMTDNEKLTEKMKGVHLVDVLGYEEHDGVWYEVYKGEGSEENVEVSDFMAAVIVDDKGNRTTVDSVSGAIDDLQVGRLAGYTKVGEEWYEVYVEEGSEENVPATGILATIAHLTVKEMSDNDTLSEEIRQVTLADVLGYEQHGDTWYEKYEGEESESNVEVSGFMSALLTKSDGSLTKVSEVSATVDEMTVGDLTGYKLVGGEWINDDGKVADGILGALVDMTVKDISNEDEFTNKINNIDLYVILGYEKHGDTWYETFVEEDSPENVPANKLMSALFEKDGEFVKLGSVSDRIESMKVGEFAGFTYDTEKLMWVDENGKEAKGVLAAMADMNVSDMSNEAALTDKIKTVELGYAMGYYFDEGTSTWYTDSSMTEKPGGVMGSICGTPVGEIESTIDETALGELLGYERSGENWVDPDKDNEPASNVIAAIADLKFKQLNDEDALSGAIEKLSVADAMGYTLGEDGKYYKDGEAMTGVMAVIAGTPINGIQEKVDSSETGELMGYYKVVTDVPEYEYALDINGDILLDEDNQPVYATDAMGNKIPKRDSEGNIIYKVEWYESVDEDGNPTDKVHPLMAKVANTNFKDLGNMPKELTLGDVISESDRTGLVALVPHTTKIDELPGAVDDVFNKTTLKTLAEKDIIEFEDGFDKEGNPVTAEQRKTAFMNKPFAEWEMKKLMEFLLEIDDSVFNSGGEIPNP